MADEQTSASDPRAELAFRDLLNAHGYGFRHRVLREAEDLRVPSIGPKARWTLRASELPVELNQNNFTIDGVLEFVTPDRALRVFAVVECTRVDPSYGRWCFVRATNPEGSPMFDVYRVAADRELIARTAWLDGGDGRLMQLGLELESNGSGARGNKSLDDAMMQVRRGAAGLAERLPEWIRDAHPALIVPLVVTTASLLVTQARLDDADPNTGDIAETPLKSVPWVWYSENVSKSLLPRAQRDFSLGLQNPLNEILVHEHQRAVMIANAAGLKDALATIAQQSLSNLR